MKKETLFKVLDGAKEKQKAVLLIGDYGIGKSQLIYSYAEQKAMELNKKLVIWHQLSEDEKKRLVESESLKDYFIVVDLKLQTIGDISKITGIPIILNNSNEHKVFWELPSFLKVLTKPEADGVLFLDEINMALPSLQSTCFELLLQKKVGEWKLNENILIVGAGNTLESNISANPIPKPLINRCILVHFYGFDTEDWIEWALKKGIDERVISYVKLFRELIRDTEDELQQSTRPRSFEILSDMIKDSDDLDYIEMVANGILHKADAVQFTNFVKLMNKLDYKKYIDEPSLFDKEEAQTKYALITIISKNIDNIDKDKLVRFITHISTKDAEFSLLLLSLLKSKKSQVLDKVLEKLPKEIIERFINILTW